MATPERVALALPVAGIGYRSIAYLLDILAIAAVWTIAYFLYTLVGPSVLEVYEGMSNLARVLAVLAAFAVQWLYWTTSEVFWNGQTLGKRLLRIRVVRSDGSAVGFFESATRNLVRVLDFLPAMYAVGVLSMLFTREHRRLGDLLAGTLLLREESITLDKYVVASPVLPSISLTTSTPLAPSDVELILAFLDRAPAIEPVARDRIARQMVAHYGLSLSEHDRAAVAASYATAETFLRSRAQSGG